MIRDYLFVVPLLVFLIFPFTFFLTYTIAVLLKHVQPDFLYISDSGNYPPESCVFAELINIGSLLMAMTVYLRYRQVKEYHRCFPLHCYIVLINTCAMWAGYFSCFGMSLAANFQQASVATVHLIGAATSFGFATLYFWFQAVISHYMYPIAHGIWMVQIRYALSVVCSIGLTLGGISWMVATWVYFKDITVKSWHPPDSGWELHTISTACEWITAIGFSCYILTFVQEFRTITLHEPPMVLRLIVIQIPDRDGLTSNGRPAQAT